MKRKEGIVTLTGTGTSQGFLSFPVHARYAGRMTLGIGVSGPRLMLALKPAPSWLT
ncbi:MAG: hypothetical protein HWD63_05555 [Candidatus Parvibacillus calidus]|nr:MAG: hypothetical protein HWD63_05555 [Candidatus Parvibacillus calidus]